MTNEYGLLALQIDLIAALDAMDSLCRENGIRYSIHGGALLGAVRNSELLPWDDDLDVSMTRENFERFRFACAAYTGPYTLNESNTWLPRFATVDPDKPIVFIDIFIWDYISENKLAQVCKIHLLRLFQGMLKTDIAWGDYDWKGKVLTAVTFALGKLFPRKAKLRWFQKLGQYGFVGKKRLLHRSNDSFRAVAMILDAHVMDDYIELPLEGKHYMVSARYRDILLSGYGPDYMTPPPESERKPAHTAQRAHFVRKESKAENTASAKR